MEYDRLALEALAQYDLPIARVTAHRPERRGGVPRRGRRRTGLYPAGSPAQEHHPGARMDTR